MLKYIRLLWFLGLYAPFILRVTRIILLMTTKEEIESGGQLRLKFFDYITWVDANMTIQG